MSRDQTGSRPRCALHDPGADTTGILVLVDDETCRELILDVLGDDLPITVARTAVEARRRLANVAYRLVILTNFGLPAETALAVIPADHAYPALLISGPLDEGIRRACERKRIRWLTAPFALEALREAVAAALRAGHFH